MTLRRFPYATAVTFVVTAGFSIAQFVDPSLLPLFERDPGLIADGEWWRLATSLVFQDGGIAGTVSNLLFLLVLGVLAELALGPWRWLALYLAGAVAGQAAGYLTGTVGAGNSIAVCGLAGGVLAGYTRGVLAAGGRGDRAGTERDVVGGNAHDPVRDLTVPGGAVARPGLERAAVAVAAFWCLLMVTTIGLDTVAFLAVVFGAVALVGQRDRLPWAVLPAVSAASAVLLAALGNLHGFALIGGALVGVLIVPAPASGEDSPG
jgi:membrane associated rhomboid family serine protease